MADPQQVLSDRVHDAIVASFGAEYGDADPLIRPSSFADFQANVALPLGKRLRRPPREVAAELAARLDVADVCTEPEVSGPGFINLTLRDDWIAAQASRMLGDARLGVPSRPRGRRRWWWTTPRPTWPRRCTSGTCAPPSSATPSRASWSSPGTG